MSWDQIPGWYDFDDIYAEAIETAPQGSTLIEVGVAFGRSLASLARMAIDARRDDLVIVGVDPWVDDWNPDWTPREGESTRPAWGAEHAEWARQQGGPFNAFVAMMREHAREELERVRVIRGKWGAVFNAFAFAEERVHMIFIDGDHRYEGVRADIASAIDTLSVGGILAGHDFTPDFPGVEKAVAELLPQAVRRRNSWYCPPRKVTKYE